MVRENFVLHPEALADGSRATDRHVYKLASVVAPFIDQRRGHPADFGKRQREFSRPDRTVLKLLLQPLDRFDQVSLLLLSSGEIIL